MITEEQNLMKKYNSKFWCTGIYLPTPYVISVHNASAVGGAKELVHHLSK